MRQKLMGGPTILMALVAGTLSTAAAPAEKAPTFNQDVAPIIFANCASCHQPNQIAPMSLLSFKEVRPWARVIKDKVTKRIMPPWYADPRFGEFANDRRLSTEQINTIAAWVDAGAPEGDTPLTVQAPAADQEWTHPSGRPPDFIVEMADAFNVPAQGELPNFNIYQELPSELKTEDHYIEAIQILPGVISAVHHAVFSVMPLPPGTKVGTGEAWPGGPVIPGALLDAKTGKLSAGRGEVNEQGESTTAQAMDRPSYQDVARFCCYVPGGTFMQFPSGAGKFMPKDGYIVWGLHYTTIGKPAADRTRVGLWFQKELIHEIVEKGEGGDRTNIVQGTEVINDAAHPVGRGAFAAPALPVIPPHTPDFAITAIQVFQDDATMWTVWPHMHTRGKEMTYVLTYPDGREQVLISNPTYDFNWQLFYDLKKPLKIPAGSTIKTVGSYDNSVRNRNVAQPDKEVYWSEQSWDEMFNGFMEISYDKDDRKPKGTFGGQ